MALNERCRQVHFLWKNRFVTREATAIILSVREQ
jgi:hypothetical protein